MNCFNGNITVTFNKTIFVFAVDQWIFERDIDRGFLGEAIASKLVFPHLPLFGNEYLNEKEVSLKKRLILELLENLIVNFPELVKLIQIKPQYFMYEVFSNRIRVFPLIAYDVANLTSCLLQNEEKEMTSYKEALNQLEAEEKIINKNGYLTITKKFISQCQNPRIKIARQLLSDRKAREESKSFAVEGVRLAEEALRLALRAHLDALGVAQRVAHAGHGRHGIAQRGRQVVRVALADEDDRLAALADRAQPRHQAAQRRQRHLVADALHRRSRIVGVLLLEHVARVVDVLAPLERVDRRHGRFRNEGLGRRARRHRGEKGRFWRGFCG